MHSNRLLTRLALLTLLLFPTALRGQTVLGVVSEQGSGTPIRGAFVSLIDSTGNRQRGYLTDEAGRYIMRAPAVGLLRLHVERLGYESMTTDTFSLAAHETRSFPLTLTVSALRLPEITVSRSQRCVANPQRALETARVWQEVRKALNVAAWLQQGGQARFRVRTFEQDLSAELKPIGQERVAFGLSEGQNAFNAAPADSLERFGFVQQAGTDVVYFGPDAELMTRPEFLEQHCFRLQRTRERPGLLGLAFEPVRGRRLPDIKGVLWLDEKTGALRYLDYEFTNLRFAVNARYANGRTDFEQLPNGAWIIRNWVMTTPKLVLQRRRGVRVAGATRHGGEVVDVVRGDSTQRANVPRVTITGSLYDSLRAQPLSSARIVLPATPYDTHTDSSGAFRLVDVPFGEYYVVADHPRIDSIPALPPMLRLRADSIMKPIALAIPSRATLLHQICGATPRLRVSDHRTGAVGVELVADSSRAPLRYVDVRLYGQEATRIRLEAKTDVYGRAVLCGDLGTGPFYIEVSNNDKSARSGPHMLPPERILRLVLHVAGTLSRTTQLH